jgi:nicotinate-nucleotide pyrophosphorylase (carboxylating)
MDSSAAYLQRIVSFALAEDLGSGDATTKATLPMGKDGQGELLSRQDGILSGTEVFDAVMAEMHGKTKVEWNASDGDRLKSGQVVARVSGLLAPILAGERVALNFLAHMSGIATRTRRFVEGTKGHQAKILDTRKTTPGLRHLEKYAVRCGGGENHRIGLYDMILVKENHIKAAGSLLKATQSALVFAGRAKPRLAVEVEVGTVKEAAMVAELSADRVMLDNMSIKDMRAAVSRIREISDENGKFISIEASGGISIENVHEVAETGVDSISVGSLTHSSPAFDFSFLIT